MHCCTSALPDHGCLRLPSCRAFLLQEIASALDHLHRNDIVHEDLSGGSVLLFAAPAPRAGLVRGTAGSRRRFTAKVRQQAQTALASSAVKPISRSSLPHHGAA